MNTQPTVSRRILLSLIGLAAASVLGFFAGQHYPAVVHHERQAPTDAVLSQAIDAPLGAAASELRPIIGIASLADESYVRAVRQAGGVPVILPNTDGDTSRIDEYLNRLDGLLLPGGADIPPGEYGETAHESVVILDSDRYKFERSLTTAWIERSDKPLLGICLGSQWINVASGGSLVQDIPTEYGVNHRGVSHPVMLQSETRLAEILGCSEVEVNSSHHQSVKQLGRNLIVAASSPDGVIEATETTDRQRFLIGVQWHPERLVPFDQIQVKLLRAFVDAAAAQQKQTSPPASMSASH